MAVFKPTDCSPFSGCFDMYADKPIFLECKVDTSNTVIKGYKIEIYNEDNERVFPSENLSGKEYGITKIEDLHDFVESKFKEYTIGYDDNLNTGVNGSYIKIPFMSSETPGDDSTVGRNIYTGEPGITNGKNYTWYITLYQTIEEEGVTTNYKYYDMPVYNGQIMGSTNERIQTKKIMDGVSLLNRFLQPLQVKFSEGKKPSFPENINDWGEDYESDTQIYSRQMIDQYDPTYGYIYPSIGNNNSLPANFNESVNAFSVYKLSNDTSLLSDGDMVDMIVTQEVGSNWTYHPNSVNPGASYFEQKIIGMNTKDGPYTMVGNTQVYPNQRILINNFNRDNVGDSSPFNGVYVPTVMDTKTNATDPAKYDITIKWQRSADLDNWGEIVNKVLYNKADKMNYEVNTRSLTGELNSTPIRYVLEKPIKIYNNEKNQITISNVVPTGDGLWKQVSSDQFAYPIGEIVSIMKTTSSEILGANSYIFETGTKNLFIYGSGTFSITYIPYNPADYIGIILFTGDESSQKLYLRPSKLIDNGMLLQKLGAGNENIHFPISGVNKEYYCINLTDEMIGSFKIDDRYQVKTYFKKSDANPVEFMERPTIKLKVYDDTGEEVTADDEEGIYKIKTINATFRVKNDDSTGYFQKDLVMWRSYQWNLYEAMNRGEQSTDGSGNIIDPKTSNIYPISLIDSSSESYDGVIEKRVYGIESDDYAGAEYDRHCIIRDGTIDLRRYYILDLTVVTNNNYVVTKRYYFKGDYTTSDATGCSITQDPVSSAVKIGIKSQEGMDVSIYRREVWYDEFSEDEAENVAHETAWIMLTSKAPNGGTYWDLGVGNNRTYEYKVCYSPTKPSSSTAVETQRLAQKTCMSGWHIIELHDPTPSRITEKEKYEVSLKDVWKFRLNLEGGQQTQNLAKTKQDTLAQYPIFSHGKKNHMSGSVSCLLGREFTNAAYTRTNYVYEFDTATQKYKWKQKNYGPVRNIGGYNETLSRFITVGNDHYKTAEELGFTKLTSNAAVDMLNAWRDVCYSGNPKLLKDEKGQVFLVQISEASNTTNEFWGDKYPETISFEWTEIGESVNVGYIEEDGDIILDATENSTT